MSLMAILIASILGSPHCAGMCGGLVAFYSASAKNSPWPHLAYNLGRAVSYVIMGAIAGFFGQSLDLAGSMVGVQRTAAIAVGIGMVVWGLAMLFGRASLGHSISTKSSGGLGRLVRFIVQKAVSWSALKRASAIGLASGLLPCGWLWVYAAAAAATASVVGGMLVMLVFWIGTLPIMVSLGGLTAFLSGRLERVIPRVTAGLLVFAGVMAILGHLHIVSFMDHSQHHGHGHGAPTHESAEHHHHHHH